MKVWDSKSLAEALKVEVKNQNIETGIVQFNSRDVKAGDLFIALQGANGNGHDYALDAYERGASVLVLDRNIEGIPEEKCILVKDTAQALTDMAIYKRANTKAKILAITGSAGKTSTRDWLKITLAKFGKTFSSRGSFNNILGVRLELASMPMDLDYGIFEVGMNHSGEIREFISYIKPNIAMINNVLLSHIGNFDSMEGIADAKSEIFESMEGDGIAILNKSNEYFEHCKKKAEDQGIKEIYSFGEGEASADSNLIKYDMSGEHIIHIDGRDISFKTQIGGQHRILNLTAILLICKVLGLDLEKASKTFPEICELKGRGQISEVKYNGFNLKLIDDAYNAAYPAMIESLKYLADLKHDYKVAILGDMRELGKDEIQYHLDLLRYVRVLNKVHCVGPLMKHLYDKLPTEIKGHHYEDYEDLHNNLKDVIDRDMMVLFKAANGVMLWKVVQGLLN